MKLMSKKNTISLLLVLALLFGLTVPVFAVETEENRETAVEETVSQAENEIIYIQTAEDLIELADHCRLNTWSVGKTVILQADISLNDTDFLPIPSFYGVFDGNGHTIQDLQITDSAAPAGLFGQVQTTGVIKDLTVSGFVVPDGDARSVGGIAGENYGTIINCSFTGSIIGDDSVGGIAGINAITGRITGCQASGTVSGSNMTGGIAGCNLGMIGSSENKAYINTVSVDPSIDPEDLNLDFLTDLSKLSSLDTSTAAMDTGGIAGYSTGVIEACVNKASVGYPHIGYNVGGIVGRNCGYIHNCENKADIWGRKDVGGITGQLEPYIAKSVTESTLAKLERQLDELDALLDDAVTHADRGMSTVTNRLNSIADSMNAAGAAAQDIRTSGTVTSSVVGSGETSGNGSITGTLIEGEKGGSVSIGDGSVNLGAGGSISSGIEGETGSSADASLDARTQIEVSTNLAGISSSIYGMAAQINLLSGEIDGVSGELNEDIVLIKAKIGEITETVFSLTMGEEERDVLVDSSTVDIDGITLGKTAECVNSGSVGGDINVGGIAGVMGMEYTLDPEDDVSVSISGAQRSKYEIKAVVQKCKNNGTVTAKRNYAGGIAGNMDMGLIAQCESYGSVTSENGNYVGGIAGITGSVVRHSFAKCVLSGGKYVGGVVGSGVAQDSSGESSTVVGCFTMVSITDYKQYAGAVSGFHAGTYLENYFVSDELAGIDRLSYSGEAEPLTYHELIAMFDRTEEARKFKLDFVVDGEVISSEIFDYGASFDAEIYPEIPQKDGYYAYWDMASLENLKFDTTVTAVYEAYSTALASADTRNDVQNVFFVEGLFDDDSMLQVESMVSNSTEFGLSDGFWKSVRKCFTDSELITEVVEQWRVVIPDDGQKFHTVRYLPPDDKADQMKVYVWQDGKWVKTETEGIGSYVTFSVEENDVKITIVSVMQVWWIWLILAVILLVLVFLMARLITKRKKSKPQAMSESDEEKTDAGSGGKKERKWLLPVLAAAVLLVGIGAIATFILRSDLMTGMKAYKLLETYTEKTALSMELQGEVTLGNNTLSVTADIDRTMLDGQQITVITENGRCIYYTDGTVFMENGNAYKIGNAYPDYSQLLEQTMALYKQVDIEEEDGIYTITAGGENAANILEILMPSMASVLSGTDSLTAKLIAHDDELEAIEFNGSARFNDENKTSYTVHAVLKMKETATDVKIPETVADAIASGEYEVSEALTDDLYRLATGWQELNNREPLAAELVLRADCGPLALNESLQLYRWPMDGEPVFSVQENGYALYFTEDAIYDSKGNSVPAVNAANIDASKLLEIAYTFCMNASADCEVSENSYTYTISLDEEGMKSVAYAVAPEAEKLDIAFDSGFIRIVLTDGTIESMEAEVNGSVQILLSRADVSIGAKLEFSGDGADESIPEAVLNALQ